MKNKKMNIIKKSYKYPLVGFLVVSILFSIFSFKTTFGQSVPTIRLDYNFGNNTVSWTSTNLSDSEASCTLFLTRFLNSVEDQLLYKKSINPSGGSVNFDQAMAGWNDKRSYLTVIDCKIDKGPWVVHSNQLFLKWHGELKGNDWYEAQYEPVATDKVRVFGGRSWDRSPENDFLAPYDSSDIPFEIAFEVQNMRGPNPDYDVPNQTDRDGREMTVTCSFTRSDEPNFIEQNPEKIIKIYNIKNNFEAKVTCHNIISLDYTGGPKGFRAYITTSDTLFIRVRPNPEYKRVLVTPVPPLVPFGGNTKINFKSNGDFCNISEIPLANGDRKFPADWTLRADTANGDFPISDIQKQAKFKVECYTEHTCVGRLPADDAKCGVTKSKNDCFNVNTESPVHTSICNWKEATGSCKKSGPPPWPWSPPCTAFNKQDGCDKQPYCKWKSESEAMCNGINSSDNNTCKTNTNSIDCANTVSSYISSLCNWGRVNNSTTGGNVGAKDPTATFLNFETATVRIYNFALDMMGLGYIVDTETTAAESITNTTAVLTGEMNPSGSDDGVLRSAKAYFRYTYVDTFPPIFCNDIFGSNMLSTTEQEVGPANSIQKVTSSVANLFPNTTYYYCIVGSNSDQITYGGVSSFKTSLTDPNINGNPDPNYYLNKISVTTKSATVANGNSAYLRGDFNTEIAATTWFEYRKKSSGAIEQNVNNDTRSSASIFDFFFKPNTAIAATTSTGNLIYQWSKKVGEKERLPNTNGNFSTLLDGLSPSTTYEFRAIIKDTRFSSVKFGDTFSFTTKSATTSEKRTTPPVGGVPYQNPCTNIKDLNCNGTGPENEGGETGGNGIGLVSLSDLTAGITTASSLSIKIPITLSVTIVNQGSDTTSANINDQRSKPRERTPTTDKTGSSTTPAVKIINNQKRVTPTSIPLPNSKPTTKGTPIDSIKPTTGKEIEEEYPSSFMEGIPTAPNTYYAPSMGGGGSTSFLRDLFKVNTAMAATNNNPTATGTRTSGIFSSALDVRGAISGPPPAPVANDTKTSTGAISPDSSAPTTGDFYSFFQVSKIDPTTVSEKNGSFINLPSVKMGNLGPKNSRVMTQEYTFNSEGTYYIRACADKKNPSDTGMIQESYENNNCGPWATFVTGNLSKCMDQNALNYGMSLPCVSKVGKCLDFSSTNYGAALPCTFAPANDVIIDNIIDSGNNTTTNINNVKLGDTATPPSDAIVRSREGIETVFARQIMKNIPLAKSYGYQEGANLQSFAWNLSDLLAKTFGYVNNNKQEIRVSQPDIAAYELFIDKNGILTVNEYYNLKIVNTQKMTDTLRSKYNYEYYFKK